jgi:hypothetical protein
MYIGFLVASLPASDLFFCFCLGWLAPPSILFCDG